MAVVNIHKVLPTPRPELYPAHAFSKRILARVLRDRYADRTHHAPGQAAAPRARTVPAPNWRRLTPQAAGRNLAVWLQSLHSYMLHTKKWHSSRNFQQKPKFNVIHSKENLKDQVILLSHGTGVVGKFPRCGFLAVRPPQERRSPNTQLPPPTTPVGSCLEILTSSEPADPHEYVSMSEGVGSIPWANTQTGNCPSRSITSQHTAKCVLGEKESLTWARKISKT